MRMIHITRGNGRDIVSIGHRRDTDTVRVYCYSPGRHVQYNTTRADAASLIHFYRQRRSYRFTLERLE